MKSAYCVTLTVNGKKQGLTGNTLFEKETDALNYLVNLAMTTQHDFFADGFSKVDFFVDMKNRNIRVKTFNTNVLYSMLELSVQE
jgi:hypothetical protein